MTALLGTIQHERVGRGAKASRAIALSCAHQREAGNSAPLSRGHHVHVVSNQPKKGFSVTPPDVLTHLLPVELARALSRVLFQLHSHWSRCSSSPAVTNRGVSIAPALPSVPFNGRHGSRRSVVHSATRQHFSQTLADVVHLSRPSPVSSVVKSLWTEGMPTSCQSLPKWSVK